MKRKFHKVTKVFFKNITVTFVIINEKYEIHNYVF